MKHTLRFLTLLTVSMTASTVAAQPPPLPTGNWESNSHPTSAFVADSTFYLNINIAGDGRFQGVWRLYLCHPVSTTSAYGIVGCNIFGGDRVSGRFGPDRQGVMEVPGRGRLAFAWSVPGADELAIELPKEWQGDPNTPARARLTRDGKGKPPGAAAIARAEASQLSANVLYREFKQDEKAALERHGGKTLVLEGRRGTLIETSDGGAAIHIADGFTDRALVLFFDKAQDVAGLGEGVQFRFRCIVSSFDYQYVHLDDCSIVQQ